MAERGELDVLVEQLEELLGEGAVDISDAYEIAVCAGLAQRLGADDAALAGASAWRAGPGQPLLDELQEELQIEPLVDAIEGLLGVEADDETIEDAVFDFDELVVAAVWMGCPKAVGKAARTVAETVRMSPESFACMGPYGRQMSRLRAVGEEIFLYDYWLALADADEA